MATQTTRILGIDPGSHHMGIGCVEKTGNKLRLLFCEILHAPKNDTLYDRLEIIGGRFQKVLQDLRPDTVAVEDIFFAKNVRSAIYLGTARGMAIGACLSQGLKIHEYAPTLVKSVVTGHGRSDKVQVQKMVQLILGTRIELGFDATDAVAVAICHANHLDRDRMVRRLST
ncbi:crossover junction endodeoxyribonuclease RuvC [bacterium]|nr:crossover junction endodeoxyribonuclease RuvC [bacterium]